MSDLSVQPMNVLALEIYDRLQAKGYFLPDAGSAPIDLILEVLTHTPHLVILDSKPAKAGKPAPSTQEQVMDALKTLLQHSDADALNYAVNYANAAVVMEMHGHELYVQVLYVLNNMTGWRGGTAKQVRAVLKAFPKQ